jgi:hypothetical protein
LSKENEKQATLPCPLDVAVQKGKWNLTCICFFVFFLQNEGRCNTNSDLWITENLDLSIRDHFYFAIFQHCLHICGRARLKQ